MTLVDSFELLSVIDFPFYEKNIIFGYEISVIDNDVQQDETDKNNFR